MASSVPYVVPEALFSSYSGSAYDLHDVIRLLIIALE